MCTLQIRRKKSLGRELAIFRLATHHVRCQGLTEMLEARYITQNVQTLKNKDNKQLIPVPHVKVETHLRFRGEVGEVQKARK